MLPSEAAKEQSITASVHEVQPKNADPMSTILEYIDSSDRSVLKERSAIMDGIEFSNSYPTKDRMKIGICSLEVGLNLISESLGINLVGEDYRSNMNDILHVFVNRIAKMSDPDGGGHLE